MQEFSDIFAWSHADMLGIYPIVAQQYLNLQKECKSIRQKLRQFHPMRREVIKQEVDKLLPTSFIREIQHPEWLANVVVVPKKNGKWCMCVDYSNLNDACLKDTFPLPHIDQIVDTTIGHKLLSFLNAYSSYNQIPMFSPRFGKHSIHNSNRDVLLQCNAFWS